MRKILTALILLCTMAAFAQTTVVTHPKKNNPKPEATCNSCKKPISKCSYKGNHPKCKICGKLKENCPGHEAKCNTCGKSLNQCSYNGQHPAPEAAGYDVTFTCNVSSASLFIDGNANGSASGSRFLKTGSHSIKVTAEGYKDYTSNISVNRQNTSCDITLQKIPTPVKPKPISGYENGHEWVDLGLSVKWATMNIGASSPEDYGNYYAWGETTPKSSYTWKTLKYRISGDSEDKVKFSKYVTDRKYGKVDNKRTLDPSDDAAHVNWGGSWRMPTWAEQDELRENCNWTWTTMNGVNGYKVVSKRNGNSIFLPAAGYRSNSDLYYVGSLGGYWSSLDASDSDHACCLGFYSGNVGCYYYYRYYGRSVRPVCQ